MDGAVLLKNKDRKLFMKVLFLNIILFYLRIFFIAGICFFYLAFRSEKSIKRYPKYMWCKDCFKFYMYEDVKDTDQICPDCGKKLTEYNDGDYWKRNASDQSAKVPKIKKRKFKRR